MWLNFTMVPQIPLIVNLNRFFKGDVIFSRNNVSIKFAKVFLMKDFVMKYE